MAGGLTLIPFVTEDLDYPAYQLRLMNKSYEVQAGVLENEDFKVSAGSGTQVNIKSGKAFVAQTNAIQESSNTFYNGLYNVLSPVEQNPYNTVEIPTSNPQIAQIILRIYDINELKISGSSYGRIEWLNGTPTASATEAKMKEGIYEGAASLPQSSLRIASVLIPKNATTSSEFYIQNRRPWALGSQYINIEPSIKEEVGTYSLIEFNTEISGNAVMQICGEAVISSMEYINLKVNEKEIIKLTSSERTLNAMFPIKSSGFTRIKIEYKKTAKIKVLNYGGSFYFKEILGGTERIS